MKLKLTKNQFKIIVESIKKDQLKEFNLGGFSIFSLSPQLGMVKSLIDLFNGGSLTPDELKSELKKVKEKKDEPEKKPKIDQIVPRPVKVKQKPIQEPKVIKKPTQDVKPPDNILIGDFHVYYISIESDFFRLIGSDPSEKNLWKSDADVRWLMKSLKKIDASYENVKKVAISVGSYFEFNLNDPIYLLVEELERVFPNARLYVIQGSYGWGFLQGINDYKNQVSDYYQEFTDYEVSLVEPPVGFTQDPKDYLPIYQKIANSLDDISI